VWLAWQGAIVRERLAMKQWVTAHGGDVTASDHMEVVQGAGMIMSMTGAYRPVSFIRRLLGDRRIAQIMLRSATSDEDARKVQDAFPEAVVYFDDLRTPNF